MHAKKAQMVTARVVMREGMGVGGRVRMALLPLQVCVAVQHTHSLLLTRSAGTM